MTFLKEKDKSPGLLLMFINKNTFKLYVLEKHHMGCEKWIIFCRESEGQDERSHCLKITQHLCMVRILLEIGCL